MNLGSKVTIPQQVLARKVGDETVVLDMATGSYFGLDAVGARIWQLLAEGFTLAEVCREVQAEYDVESSSLERDVLALVEGLRAQRLVEID